MSIESEAQKDLALSDEDAEGIAGGKKTKKTTAKGHTVPFIKVAGFSGTPDSTLPESDCDPDETT